MKLDNASWTFTQVKYFVSKKFYPLYIVGNGYTMKIGQGYLDICSGKLLCAQEVLSTNIVNKWKMKKKLLSDFVSDLVK